MILYSQRDPRWASHSLGWGPALGTIGAYGCLDTVFAMIAQDAGLAETPATMDNLFTAAHIFVREPTGTYDLLPDNALVRAWPERFRLDQDAPGFRADLIGPAVRSAHTYAYGWIATAAVPTHFVLFYSADGLSIADPWTGRVGPLAGYGGPGAIKRTMTVTALPPPAPAAPPPPAPVPPIVVPLPTPPLRALYSFNPSDGSELRPAAGVMTLGEAAELADAWTAIRPGVSIWVNDANGNGVYQSPPLDADAYRKV